jgi:hypothetical protein
MEEQGMQAHEEFMECLALQDFQRTGELMDPNDVLKSHLVQAQREANNADRREEIITLTELRKSFRSYRYRYIWR